MESTSIGNGRVLCCADGVWKLVDQEPPEEARSFTASRSPWNAEGRIAALEAANHALRAAAEIEAEGARFRLAEVEHRLKNTFATVGALAAQTRRHSGTGAAFHDAFGARLLALARSNELLSSEQQDGASLAEVIGWCLVPYDDASGRTTVSGPEVRLPGKAVSTLGLAFHELATNAAKHGALSTSEGRVEVTWRLEPERAPQSRSVEIVWREQGGPPVRPPEQRGFGSRLLERGLAQQAGGTAQLDFAPRGVECRIWLPLTAAGSTRRVEP